MLWLTFSILSSFGAKPQMGNLSSPSRDSVLDEDSINGLATKSPKTEHINFCQPKDPVRPRKQRTDPIDSILYNYLENL